jgi:hypothetical protein
MTISTKTGRALIPGASGFNDQPEEKMKIKLKEARGIAGVLHQIGDIVDVAEGIARDFSARGWAETEEDVRAVQVSKAKKGDIVEAVGDLSATVHAMGQSFDTITGTIDGLSERVSAMEDKFAEFDGAFDVDPALMTGPEIENREADQAAKTAKRDADTKKKGK